MGNNYSFYVFNGLTRTYETPREAAEAFKADLDDSSELYLALGITVYSDYKDPIAIDLVVKHSYKEVKLSADIEQSEATEDSLVMNTLHVYKEIIGL